MTKTHMTFRQVRVRDRVMVFNATFKNISAISWQSVLLTGEESLLKNHYHDILNSELKLYEVNIE